MRQKLIPCLLAALLLLATTALARDVTVTVDGAALPGQAFAENGTTYAPLVPLLEALGGWQTRWDASSRTALAETDLFSLAVPAGSAACWRRASPWTSPPPRWCGRAVHTSPCGRLPTSWGRGWPSPAGTPRWRSSPRPHGLQ